MNGYWVEWGGSEMGLSSDIYLLCGYAILVRGLMFASSWSLSLLMFKSVVACGLLLLLEVEVLSACCVI